MTLPRAVGILLALSALYLGVLAWADARGGVFAHGAALWSLAPVLCGASWLSYVLRYARWRWLLGRAGRPVAGVPGFLAYVAGFAFTATPGKVGELLRVRYFGQQGVPGATVVGAFVFERAMDLVVVLALGSLYVVRPDVWLFVAFFVAGFLACLALVAWRPQLLFRMAAWIRARGGPRLSRPLVLLGQGLLQTRRWLTLPDLLVSLACGFAAWGLTSWAFLHLLRALAGLPVPTMQVLAMYPLAMLAGAASMLPGGIGSTEVALVALVAAAGVPVAVGAVAAVGIRLATLWFAIACGVASVAILELRQAGTQAGGVSSVALPDDRPSPP